MAIVTLTSDYGLKDHYLPSLKGALLSHSPTLTLVDVSHYIAPANIMEAAFILRQAYPNFPKGTVHLISVSELGKDTQLLAMQMDGHYFLCADNGILSLLNPERKIDKLVAIDFREDMETKLFPSKDVLAKAAAHLAQGGAIGLLGRALKEMKQHTVIRPRLAVDESMILGNVLYVDNFGNLITNISKRFFNESRKERDFEISLPRKQKVHKISTEYQAVRLGDTLALFNAQGLLEIAVNGAGNKGFNGAHTLLGINVMDTVTINFV